LAALSAGATGSLSASGAAITSGLDPIVNTPRALTADETTAPSAASRAGVIASAANAAASAGHEDTVVESARADAYVRSATTLSATDAADAPAVETSPCSAFAANIDDQPLTWRNRDHRKNPSSATSARTSVIGKAGSTARDDRDALDTQGHRERLSLTGK
jgi:hypothetical protein